MLPWIIRDILFNKSNNQKQTSSNRSYGGSNHSSIPSEQQKNNEDNNFSCLKGKKACDAEYRNNSIYEFQFLDYQQLNAVRFLWDEPTTGSNSIPNTTNVKTTTTTEPLLPFKVYPFHTLPTQVFYEILQYCLEDINNNEYEDEPESRSCHTSKYASTHDLNVIEQLLLVSKAWSDAILDILYFNVPLIEGKITMDTLSQLLSNGNIGTCSITGNNVSSSSSTIKTSRDLSIKRSSIFSYGLKIRELEFRGAIVDDLYLGDLQIILSKVPNLESFTLVNCFHASNLLVQSIAENCPLLMTINLSGCPTITDKYIEKLCLSCECLEEIVLSKTRITLDSVFHILKWCRHLSVLDLTQVDLNSNSSTDDSHLTTYDDPQTHIEFHKKDIFDSCVKQLGLSGTGISKECLFLILSKCTNSVEHLDVSDISCVDDDVLQFVIDRCPNIHTLNLYDCEELSPEALDKISFSTISSTIKYIFANPTMFSEKSIERMLHHCSILDTKVWQSYLDELHGLVDEDDELMIRKKLHPAYSSATVNFSFNITETFESIHILSEGNAQTRQDMNDQNSKSSIRLMKKNHQRRIHKASSIFF